MAFHIFISVLNIKSSLYLIVQGMTRLAAAIALLGYIELLLDAAVLYGGSLGMPCPGRSA